MPLLTAPMLESVSAYMTYLMSYRPGDSLRRAVTVKLAPVLIALVAFSGCSAQQRDCIACLEGCLKKEFCEYETDEAQQETFETVFQKDRVEGESPQQLEAP
jgi:hypothetical protein